MLIDYKSLNTQITAVIKELGFPIAITRDGASGTKGYAVSTPTSVEDRSIGASIQQTTFNTLYITAGPKFEPKLDDVITSKVVTGKVFYVEKYKPSSVAIAFRVLVS